MKITVGSNIKRLRTEKGITQEQLADAMNVSCAAVSKWERSETYPDITMLQPLAFYFGVSLDALMGYDEVKVNEEIANVFNEYEELRWRNDGKAQDLIKKAYKDYPGDFKIMYHYMWSLGVSDAEPDLKLALTLKPEIEPICDKIIDGCQDVELCLGAWKMKAILLHAEGKTDEALKIHNEKFGNWYFSTGQMNEQLFTKDRPEFLYWARKNMFELGEYAADKLVKSYFYDLTIPCAEMVKTLEKLADSAFSAGCEMNDGYFISQAESIYGRLRNDLIARDSRGGTAEDIIRITGKYFSALSKLCETAKGNTPMSDALIKSHHTDDLLSRAVESTLNWKNPRNVELLKNPEYTAVIEKYKK